MMNLMKNVMNMESNEKVVTSRNWVIRTQKNLGNGRFILFAGRYGKAERIGFLTEKLSYVASENIRWEYFTYKKDFDARLAELEKECGKARFS